MITPPWYQNPVETLAFNAFAAHTSELDQIVDQVCEANQQTGCTDFTISGSNLTEDDLEYIKRESEKRIR